MREVCTHYLKVAFSQTGHKTAILTRLRCKMWSCEPCAKLNAWIWRNWLLKRIPEVSEDWWLLTLTANSQTRSHVRSLDNIRKHLDAFFKRVKRVFGEIEYVRVYEKHPSSQAVHVHIIISGLSPFVAVGQSSKLQPMAFGVVRRSTRNGVWSVKSWVKKTAMELHMGYIADVQRITGETTKAVWYVCKYLTKAQSDLHVKGLRHVQVTKGIGSPPDIEKQGEWNTAFYVQERMFPVGTQIKDLNTGDTIDSSYWEQKRDRAYPE